MIADKALDDARKLARSVMGPSDDGCGMGRPPVDAVLIDTAIRLIQKGSTIHAAALAVGIHRNTLQRHLKKHDGTARPLVISKAYRAYGGSIMEILMKATPASLPQEMREEIAQELCIELLNGAEVFAILRERATQIVKQYNRQYRNKWQMHSLETPIGENGETLEDVLAG